MRMRRKKNIDARLAACADILVLYKPDNLQFQVQPKDSEVWNLSSLFGNDNPIELEIGCGKGSFVCEKARRNPDINYLAVECSENVLVLAAEQAKAMRLTNVRFIATYAEYLARVFPLHFTKRLYLNFSCPYPKKAYASHRLTHTRFLSMYKRWLADDGLLIQKTDSPSLFSFSIVSLSEAKFTLKNVVLDLHHSEIEDNIVTEYEQRFVSMGKPIYYLEATPPSSQCDLN